MICKTSEPGTRGNYKYVVVMSFYDGKILLSRHQKRETWETQGGHIEPGETPLDAARRELYEESGAIDFELNPVCDYWIEGEETSSVAFCATIRKLEKMPDSEMAEVGLFDNLPENLTYPDITPVLFGRIGVG